PRPRCTKSGPGHAPVSAQPSPNIVPPIQYRYPRPSSFGGTTIRSPVNARAPVRRSTKSESAATPTAVKIRPYMWNDWNRNISWIRNHEIASDFVMTRPKKAPTRRYPRKPPSLDNAVEPRSARSITVADIPPTPSIDQNRSEAPDTSSHPDRHSEDQRKNDERPDQPADEETDHRDQRRRRKVREPADRRTRRAPARVRRAEADQEAAEHEHDEPLQREEARPREDVRRHQTGEVLDPERLQIRDRRGRDRDRIRGGQDHAAKVAAQHQPEREHEIPTADALPVIPEEFRPARRDRRTEVPEVARDPEHTVPQQQQDRDGQPDQR